jgi:hypothetical protein
MFHVISSIFNIFPPIFIFAHTITYDTRAECYLHCMRERVCNLFILVFSVYSRMRLGVRGDAVG